MLVTFFVLSLRSRGARRARLARLRGAIAARQSLSGGCFAGRLAPGNAFGDHVLAVDQRQRLMVAAQQIELLSHGENVVTAPVEDLLRRTVTAPAEKAEHER